MLIYYGVMAVFLLFFMLIVLESQFADRDTLYTFHSSLIFSGKCVLLSFLLFDLNDIVTIKLLKEIIN